jgi:hypothetical protein
VTSPLSDVAVNEVVRRIEKFLGFSMNHRFLTSFQSALSTLITIPDRPSNPANITKALPSFQGKVFNLTSQVENDLPDPIFLFFKIHINFFSAN